MFLACPALSPAVLVSVILVFFHVKNEGHEKQRSTGGRVKGDFAWEHLKRGFMA
jgi:hypothetical protein